jgi:hypothetical protein
MRGINISRKPIKGKFARAVREAVRKAAKGEKTPEEQEAAKREQEADKVWAVVWK